MARKLVTIRKIDKLLPIKNKDRIVQAIIGGWSVIVKKDEFQEGDLCVFFEIDSFLPLEDRYSFLEKTKKTYKGKEGYRLKTMKMSGLISQGLALPLDGFLQDRTWNDSAPFFEGDDVTELANVIKYDVADVEAFQKQAKPGEPQSKFPSFLPKTDQERIQNLTHYFETLKYIPFEETLKLDGSSMTCYSIPRSPTLWEKIKSLFGVPYKNYKFGVCSRNLELKPSESNFWKAAKKYNIEQNLPCGYAIQGELIAPNIQSNHEQVSDVEFYIFDIYDIREDRYLSPSERKHMMTGSLRNIPHVPIIEQNKYIFQDCATTEELLKHVEGQSINPGTISEGRVYKATDESGISFKAISNKYLLKCEK